jgi:Ca2+-binding RTX toxin-like protein
VAFITVGLTEAATLQQPESLFASLSLVGFDFQVTETGGSYSKFSGSIRTVGSFQSFDYTLGAGGMVTSVTYRSAGSMINETGFKITGLHIPLAILQANLANVMPLLTSGNDHITGNGSAQTFYAGAGDDVVLALGGDDKIYGEVGNDSLNGGAGNDLVYGGTGNDYLDGGEGTDQLFGDAGDDFLDGVAGVAQMDGGDGFDMVVYNTASSGVTVNLATGHGSGGAAEVDTYTNVEAIGASAFNDILTGTDGTNYIWAGAGDDVILGLGGSDNLDGAAGDDSIYGGAGNDHLYGGDGNDTIHADAGNDNAFGGNGNDYVIGTGGALSVDGGAGHDQLYGGSAADHLSGGIGDDLLLGNGGNDRLNGSSGIDVLSGGLGADVFLGGADADYFVMNHDIAYAGYDNIGDFRDGVDWLQLPEYARHLTTVTNASFGCVVSIALADSSYNLYIAGVNAHQIADQIYYYGT